MQKQQQHINHLLHRWITGEITAKEERELENVASEDEFVREALAGYRSQSGADHETRLANLRQRLQPAQKPVRQLRPWMRVAAAVALLVAASWAVFQTQNINETSSLADQKTETVESAPVEETARTDTKDEQLETVLESEPEPEKNRLETVAESPAIAQDNTATSTPTSPQASAPIAATIEETEPAGYTNTADFDQALATEAKKRIEQQVDLSGNKEEAIVLDGVPLAENDDVVTSPPPPPPAPASDAYRTQNQGPPPVRLDDQFRYDSSNAGPIVARESYRVINGFVTDEQGNPLIGASILEQGSANGTVADIDGYYEITVSKESETLVVSYTGFEAIEIPIGDDDEILIALSEGRIALDEVVVTGLGATRQKDATALGAEESSIGDAEPVDGFDALRDYLQANAPVNTGRATVKLRFYIQANGRPANFSIIRSTNPSLNAEAIRLIENGPDWVIIGGDAPREVVYSVKFR